MAAAGAAAGSLPTNKLAAGQAVDHSLVTIILSH